jgi:protein required for attachment to host cells
MDKTWILVANASTAALYDYATSDKPTLTVVKEFAHPDSRKKDHDLASDREGQYIARAGGHGNFVESSDPHQYEATVFARELYQALEKGRVSHQYESLVLIAEPHFMGLLRQCIDERPLKNVHIREVQKEYTQKKPHELLDFLKSLKH